MSNDLVLKQIHSCHGGGGVNTCKTTRWFSLTLLFAWVWSRAINVTSFALVHDGPELIIDTILCVDPRWSRIN